MRAGRNASELLTPRGVRALAEAGCWLDLGRVHHEVELELNALARGRNSGGVPRAIRERCGGLLLELVRTPFAAAHGSSEGGRLGMVQASVWQRLAWLGHRPAAAVARTWLGARSPAVREQGARALCGLAQRADLPLVLRLLTDRDERVACGAIWGVQDAVEAGWLKPARRAPILRRLEEVVCGEAGGRRPDQTSAPSAAAGALLTLDPDRAVRTMTSPRCLSSSNPSLLAALLELTGPPRGESPSHRRLVRRLVDPARLWEIYERWRSGRTIVSRVKQPWGSYDDRLAGQLLVLGVMVDPRRTRAELAPLARRRFRSSEHLGWSVKDAWASLGR